MSADHFATAILHKFKLKQCLLGGAHGRIGYRKTKGGPEEPPFESAVLYTELRK
jgi:hypothetical protein